ncbi:hypothetical protein [Sediminibacterium ginsengisoli]|uniref:Uncharacterized protein n=1 Tax=Sediminibacterium ginsengisoli TaxID=413434 RepID=A0A1T4N5J9_9BACT|nr:hypothetical protein [Sediminibacterium ginsengisoli]SJZ74305.1 hypothetical protein SAMN04488132_10495 [Sediminibacterium ginsengisoli]
MSRQNEMVKPFVIFSSLTEEKGHLLLDDDFWFSSLIKYDPELSVFTSVTSCDLLAKKYPSHKKQFIGFRDFPFFRKIYYRLHLLGRLFSSKKITGKTIIFQGFDEIGILSYLWRIRNWNNTTVLILTNNVSPERFENSPRLLPYLLRTIFKKCDFVFYHSDFEYKLLISKLGDKVDKNKLKKVKYHLLGAPRLLASNTHQDNTITYFGPSMVSKPLLDFCNLIKADANRQFKYHFYNLDRKDEEMIRNNTPPEASLNFHYDYMTNEEYANAILQSTYVFLPHNSYYEGKLSGIFCDCVNYNVPVISDRIEPVIEFFKAYGELGYLLDYKKNDWGNTFFNEISGEKYRQFIENMNKCHAEHKADIIIESFIEKIKSENRS